jgi:hypothetical protein
MIAKREELGVTLVTMGVLTGFEAFQLPGLISALRALDDTLLAMTVLIISVIISFVIVFSISIERSESRGRGLKRSWIGIGLAGLTFGILSQVPLSALGNAAYHSLFCGYIFAFVANALASQLTQR